KSCPERPASTAHSDSAAPALAPESPANSRWNKHAARPSIRRLSSAAAPAVLHPRRRPERAGSSPRPPSPAHGSPVLPTPRYASTALLPTRRHVRSHSAASPPPTHETRAKPHPSRSTPDRQTGAPSTPQKPRPGSDPQHNTLAASPRPEQIPAVPPPAPRPALSPHP